MNTATNSEKRAYRKNLNCHGLIRFGRQEYDVRVINLSVSGLLVELQGDGAGIGVKEIFQTVRISPVIDVYLPTLRLVGEAAMVRADQTEQGLRIALEFRHLNDDADNFLYYLHAYCKQPLPADGIVIEHIDMALCGAELHLYAEHFPAADGVRGNCE